MDYIPLVRSSGLLPFLPFLEGIGSPVEKWLNKARIPCCALKDPEALISLHAVTVILDEAAHREGLATLGLLVGQRTAVDQLGTFGTLVRRSLTLFEGINTAQRLIVAMNSGIRIWIEQEENQAWIFHRNLSPPSLGRQQVDLFGVSLILNLIRLATGPFWKPPEIRLQMPRISALADGEALFGARVIFDQPASVVALPTRLLSLPLIPFENPTVATSRGPEWLRRSAPALDFAGSLEQLLRSQLREGYPGIHRVAELAGMSARSVQRRLLAEGTEYGRLVQRVRFNLAMSLLNDPAIKLKDIACELGYRDAANFTRAFRRWTGTCPHEVRKHRRDTGPIRGS